MTPSAVEVVLAEFSGPPPRRADLYRVRGFNGDAVVHSRVYQRWNAALRNYDLCLTYYDRVTLEITKADPWTEV